VNGLRRERADQGGGDRRGRILQSLKNGEVVVLALDLAAQGNVQPGPHVAHQPGLADELGPLAAADPAGEGRRPCRLRQNRAFRAGLRKVQVERLVHVRVEQGAQVMKTADRQRMRDAFEHGGGQRAVGAQHARCQMPARRMSGEADRTVHQQGGGGNGAADLGGDLVDPRFRRQRVARQADGPALRPRALGEIRPVILVEPHPKAAMDKDGEALRRAVRPDEVEFFPRMAAIGDIGVEPAPARPKLVPVGRGPRGPEAGQLLGPFDVFHVGEGIVPVAKGRQFHAALSIVRQVQVRVGTQGSAHPAMLFRNCLSEKRTCLSA
jgi:predicted secreted protein